LNDHRGDLDEVPQIHPVLNFLIGIGGINQVLLGLLAPSDLLVPKVTQDTLVLRVTLVQLALKVNLDLLVLKVLKVNLDQRDLKEYKDFKELLDQTV
jgi:hypothetical protein